jgi:hypothetical protein
MVTILPLRLGWRAVASCLATKAQETQRKTGEAVGQHSITNYGMSGPLGHMTTLSPGYPIPACPLDMEEPPPACLSSIAQCRGLHGS